MKEPSQLSYASHSQIANDLQRIEALVRFSTKDVVLDEVRKLRKRIADIRAVSSRLIADEDAS